MKIPNTILAISPHTDDSELGCGGTLAKYVEEGRQVYCAVFSLCRKSLPEGLPPDTLKHECETAMKQLGIQLENLFFFDYDVRNFDRCRQQILEDIVTLQKKLQPDLVFIPSSTDRHQDHEVIHREAVRAFNNSSILGYELPWNQTVSQLNCFIPLSPAVIDKKLSSVGAYHSQSFRKYMDADYIRSLARVRGVQCGAQYAEAFETVKLIA